MNFTNKPESEWNDNDRSIKAAWDALGADDERKIHCNECGSYWYEIHYKNGCCHSCQKKGLHLKKKSSNEIRFSIIFLYLGIFFLTLSFIFNKC